MYEKVIDKLQTHIKNYRILANDSSGVLTEFTKNEYAEIIPEYENAIAALKSSGAPAEQTGNTASDAIALWIELLTAGSKGVSFETWLRANHERVEAACAQRHA